MLDNEQQRERIHERLKAIVEKVQSIQRNGQSGCVKEFDSVLQELQTLLPELEKEPQFLATGTAALVMYRSLTLRLQAVKGLVCFQRGGRERVILPPRDQGGDSGNTRRHQLFHGGALDGQHGLAQSAQHLIDQSQQQAGGTCHGARRDGRFVVSMCFHV